MKKLLTPIALILFISFSKADFISLSQDDNLKEVQKTERTSFVVKGNCKMCKKRIEKAALSIKGVKMATWDIPSNMIDIIYDVKKIDLKDVHDKISSVGHDTDKIKARDDVYDALPMCCQYRTEPIH
ncbi:MAG: heavy-metal-associated domain-containing protein [Bacteroidota bacterium]|nr:heavy-metal-associated domain-containing protein [Bacteroidota bacterium]